MNMLAMLGVPGTSKRKSEFFLFQVGSSPNGFPFPFTEQKKGFKSATYDPNAPKPQEDMKVVSGADVEARPKAIKGRKRKSKKVIFNPSLIFSSFDMLTLP